MLLMWRVVVTSWLCPELVAAGASLPLCSCSLSPPSERKAGGIAQLGPPVHSSRPCLGCSEGQHLQVPGVCPQRVAWMQLLRNCIFSS